MSQKPVAITSGARAIIEVGFDEYVRMPVTRHNTKTLSLRMPEVDTIEVRPMGILITKKDKGVTYSSLYPWSRITDVRYEPIPDAVEEAPVDKGLLG